MEVCIIFYISITIEARDSNKNPICSSWYGLQFISYKCLDNSLPLGLIKLQIYLSILRKKLFLTFKNQWEGEVSDLWFLLFVVAYMGNIIT
jgi:hypothetical protein